MDYLIKRPEQLPDTIKELNKFILIGKEKLKAYEAKLRAIEKIGLAKDVRDIALDDSQKMATALLWAEARLGELLSKIDKKKSYTGFQQRNAVLPPDINKKQSHYAQQLAAHPEIIEEIVDKAIKQEEIPRRSEVLRNIYKLHKKAEQDKIELPAGQYKTIVIDPAWPIEKIHRDTIPQGISLDYKPMSVEAIKDMKIPSAPDCHLFLWTTQKYLSISFEILKTWEFKYIFTMVWHKNGGFQPFNLPQYNCEFVLYGRKGSPKFLEIKNFFTCFNGKRREHSRKPKEFYDVIRRVCPEPRLDIFSREQIEGFECWGDESDKF